MFKPLRLFIPILTSAVAFAAPIHAETLLEHGKKATDTQKLVLDQTSFVKRKLDKLTTVSSTQFVQAETGAMETVNINTANATELAKKLKGVGSTRAQAIIDLRERLGGFSDIEQLLEVRGLGVRTLNANRERIVL